MPSGTPLRPFASTRRFGIVSTYPPKLCGLATFAAALEQGLRQAGHRVDIVRLDDGEDAPTIAPASAGELRHGSPGSMRKAAGVLSRADVVVVQHEYGIYGGADGDEVLDLLRLVEVPTIVVLHTVPLHPTSNQRAVLDAIGELADCLVVMTETAADRLTRVFPEIAAKAVVVPHGASTVTTAASGPPSPQGARMSLLTWGLLGPGKGIEHAIDALTLIGDDLPRPRYTVAGVTHPKVFARSGDAYRTSLIQRSWASGVADCVRFDDTYRNVEQLTRFVAAASLVILPYDSRDQVTSGVLVDAIAAGRPVIATAFPHAVELLATGAGITVPHADPVALADAMRAVLGDERLRESMAAEAQRIAPSLSWAAVAGQYVELADGLIRSSEAMAV